MSLNKLDYAIIFICGLLIIIALFSLGCFTPQDDYIKPTQEEV